MMLEILVLMALILLGLAKKPARKRRFNLVKAPLNTSLALSTLASNDVISAATQTVDRNCRATSLHASWSIHNLTAGEGPIVIGVAHSDYTDAEVEESLEAAAGGWSTGDKVAGEQADRLVREIGTFAGIAAEETLNDGKPIRTKLNWQLVTGAGLRFFVWNKSGAVLTTGASIKVTGHAWLTK